MVLVWITVHGTEEQSKKNIYEGKEDWENSKPKWELKFRPMNVGEVILV